MDAALLVGLTGMSSRLSSAGLAIGIVAILAVARVCFIVFVVVVVVVRLRSKLKTTAARVITFFVGIDRGFPRSTPTNKFWILYELCLPFW